MILPVNNLTVPNLAKLGLPMHGNPDLVTIWNTPYPVLTNYEKVCAELKIPPYSGGTKDRQGDESIGHINSGYRSLKYNLTIGGKDNSAHLFALAIDVWFGYPTLFKAATCAEKYFNRIIFYKRPFLHLDLTDTLWQMNYSNGKRFGVADEHGNYHWNTSLSQTIELYRNVLGFPGEP